MVMGAEVPVPRQHLVHPLPLQEHGHPPLPGQGVQVVVPERGDPPVRRLLVPGGGDRQGPYVGGGEPLDVAPPLPPARDPVGEVGLVVAGIVERRGERLERSRLFAHRVHRGHEARGVQPSREVHAQRDVGAEAEAHRVLKALQEPLFGFAVGEGRHVPGEGAQVPVHAGTQGSWVHRGDPVGAPTGA